MSEMHCRYVKYARPSLFQCMIHSWVPYLTLSNSLWKLLPKNVSTFASSISRSVILSVWSVLSTHSDRDFAQPAEAINFQQTWQVLNMVSTIPGAYILMKINWWKLFPSRDNWGLLAQLAMIFRIGLRISGPKRDSCNMNTMESHE